MSVNVPTNQKIKEQDINAKLQLYGIYAGMCLSSPSMAPQWPRAPTPQSSKTDT